MPPLKTLPTDINCPNCGEDLVFVMAGEGGAPFVSPTCFRAYWPSELSREARLGNAPTTADLRGDAALWSEVRRGRPDKPGKPEDVRAYARQRMLDRMRGL